MKKVNYSWISAFISEHQTNGHATRTTGHLFAVKAMILELDKLGIPYTLCKLGAGVTKITTITDFCPCCKRKF